jgi:hypothetical protein
MSMIHSGLGVNHVHLWEPPHVCCSTTVINLLLRAEISFYFNVNDNIIGAVLDVITPISLF